MAQIALLLSKGALDALDDLLGGGRVTREKATSRLELEGRAGEGLKHAIVQVSSQPDPFFERR